MYKQIQLVLMHTKITQELVEIKNYTTTNLHSKYKHSKLHQDREATCCQEGLHGEAVISL